MTRPDHRDDIPGGGGAILRQLTSPRDLAELGAIYGADRKFIWSLARAMQLLQAFRLSDGAMGNAELSESTGIAKATVTRITHTLTELGYLRRDAARKYYPAPMLLTLGHTVLGKLRIRQLAQRGMQELANLSGASVALSWPEEDSMVYVAAHSASVTDSLLLDVGARIGMAASAAGRAYLAQISPEERQARFERWALVYGAAWPEQEDRIMASIEEVRTRGFCIVEQEWRPGLRAAATPVHDGDHRTWMALNCGGPAYTLDRDRLEAEIGPRLVHLARQLSPR